MSEMVTVVGAGLAGCEAAWQLAQRGISVRLCEMKPVQHTPAHHSDDFAETSWRTPPVCSRRSCAVWTALSSPVRMRTA